MTKKATKKKIDRYWARRGSKATAKDAKDANKTTKKTKRWDDIKAENMTPSRRKRLDREVAAELRTIDKKDKKTRTPRKAKKPPGFPYAAREPEHVPGYLRFRLMVFRMSGCGALIGTQEVFLAVPDLTTMDRDLMTQIQQMPSVVPVKP